MPRIFYVNLSKEMEFMVVAESEAELQAALKSAIKCGEPDDWDSPDNLWDPRIEDLLKGVSISDHPEVDMGVHKGRVLAMEDYRAHYPKFREELEEAIAERKRQIALDKLNLKLPFPESKGLATRVIGCVQCAKPAALVGEVLPANGLCKWCRKEPG